MVLIEEKDGRYETLDVERIKDELNELIKEIVEELKKHLVIKQPFF